MEQAEETRDRGDHAAALVLAEAVARGGMTPAVQLFIAREHSALGHHADARAGAEACVEAVQRDRSIRHRRRLLEDCRALVAAAIAAQATAPSVAAPTAVTLASPPEVVATSAAPVVVPGPPLDVVVPAPVVEAPVVEAPVVEAPAEDETSRFAIEVGGGLGVGLILGNPQVVTPSSGFYAEGIYSLNASGAALRACRAGFQCPAVTGAAASPTGVLAASLRWAPFRDALGRRFALGVTLRWQPDAAAGDAFNALVLGARIYAVLTSGGFARRGVTLAAVAGMGYGDIQSVPAAQGSELPVAHVASGPLDLHAGLRVEVGLGRFVHGAVELVGHVLLPAQSAAIDAVGLVGVHY